MTDRDVKRLSEADVSAERGETDSNKVGNCRPPKQFQFKPGVSGNPSGRPKKTPSFASELADELCRLIVDSDGGRITKKRAIVKKIVAAAISGNVKVAIELIRLCESHNHEPDFSAADDDAFLEKLAADEPQSAAEVSSPNEKIEK